VEWELGNVLRDVKLARVRSLSSLVCLVMEDSGTGRHTHALRDTELSLSVVWVLLRKV
jgi:hypothetical protein